MRNRIRLSRKIWFARVSVLLWSLGAASAHADKTFMAPEPDYRYQTGNLCWAYAAAHALESRALNRDGRTHRISREDIAYSMVQERLRDHAYDGVSYPFYQRGWPIDAIRFIREQGLSPNPTGTYPYAFYRSSSASYQEIDGIRQWLDQHSSLPYAEKKAHLDAVLPAARARVFPPELGDIRHEVLADDRWDAFVVSTTGTGWRPHPRPDLTRNTPQAYFDTSANIRRTWDRSGRIWPSGPTSNSRS